MRDTAGLQEVRLDNNSKVGSPGVVALAEALEAHPALTLLALDGCSFGEDAAVALQGLKSSVPQLNTVSACAPVGQRDTLRCRHVLKGHQLEVYCVASAGPYVISSGTDHAVKVWDRVSGQLLHNLTEVCLAAEGVSAVMLDFRTRGHARRDGVCKGAKNNGTVLASNTFVKAAVVDHVMIRQQWSLVLHLHSILHCGAVQPFHSVS